MKILISFIVLLLSLNPSFAFEYTNQDKDMFYNAFLDGYYTEMEKAVERLDMPRLKKDNIIKEIKSSINKDELIESSWGCIQKYSISEIVAASVICTTPWTSKQAAINKKIFEKTK